MTPLTSPIVNVLNATATRNLLNDRPWLNLSTRLSPITVNGTRWPPILSPRCQTYESTWNSSSVADVKVKSLAISNGIKKNQPLMTSGWRGEFILQLVEDVLNGKLVAHVANPTSDQPLSFVPHSAINPSSNSSDSSQ